jgi:hypothetical protein
MLSNATRSSVIVIYLGVFDSKPPKLSIKTKIIFNVHEKSGLDW